MTTINDLLTEAASRTTPWKLECKLCSLVNVTLVGEQTIDGKTAEENARVLLVGQTDTKQNGPWVVKREEWLRPVDYSDPQSARFGTTFIVYDGDLNSGVYRLTAPTVGEIIPDQTATTWVRVSGLSGGSGTPDDNSVSTAKIQPLAVTTSKLAVGAVSTSKIEDAAVTLAKIVDFAAGRIAGRAIGAGDGDLQDLTTAQQEALIRAALSVAAADIAVNGQKITGLGAPSAGGDASNKTYTDAVVTFARVLAALGAASSDVSLNSRKITTLASGTVSGDAVNLGQVQALIASGIAWKQAVRAASTAAINLAAPGASIDGVTMVAGDRFLEKNHATQASRGIYVWNGAAVPATRATDADTSAEVTAGMAVFVAEGTANADTAWVLTTNNPITLGVTSLTFAQFGAGGGSSTAISQGGGSLAVDGSANLVSSSLAGVNIDTVGDAKYLGGNGFGLSILGGVPRLESDAGAGLEIFSGDQLTLSANGPLPVTANDDIAIESTNTKVALYANTTVDVVPVAGHRIGLGVLVGPNGSAPMSLYADDGIGGGPFAYEALRGRTDLGGNPYWYAPNSNLSILAAQNVQLQAFGAAITLTAATRVEIAPHLFIANRVGAPATPTGGGIQYVEGGALKYIGSSGTITTLAPA